MKADTISNRTTSGKSSKLRCLNLSFEGKDLMFKNGDMDNGRLPHGGYKGSSKKHPLGLYSWDKGKDYQRQLRDELNYMLDTDGPEANVSPQWAMEAHRQPTHSGESPLLLNKFLSPSRHETTSGAIRTKANRSTSANSGQYYRPNRMHQYLSATELKDAAGENEDVLRYGRPTRTTLLRARQRVGPSSNSYELRRQTEQRMDELRNSTTITSPKEFSLQESELDGETYHSFLTGARYNRAHCLDSKSLSQYGVYMPRNNPLGCFVVGQRVDLLDTTSAPPDSPRSDIGQGSSPVIQRRRPTTAPGYGHGRKQVVRIPPSPRQAWGDASCSLHITNGDHKNGEATENGAPVIEEIRLWSPLLNVKGSRLPLKMAREGPMRFESKLPSVHGTSLSRRHKHFQEVADDTSDANQPPPSPAGHMTSKDGSHFPAVKEEPETNVKSGDEQQEVKTEQDSKPAEEVATSLPPEPEQIELKSGEATEDTGEAADEEVDQEAHREEENGEDQDETPPDVPGTLVEEQLKNEEAECVSEGEVGEVSTEKAGEEAISTGEAGEEAISTGEAGEEAIGTGEAEQAEEDSKEEPTPEQEPPQEQQDVSSPEKDDEDATKTDTQAKFFLTEENLVGGAPPAEKTDGNADDIASQDAAAKESADSVKEEGEACETEAEVLEEGTTGDGGGGGGVDEDRPPSSIASSARSKGRRTVTFLEPDETETKENDEAGDGDCGDDDDNTGDGLENGNDGSLNDATGDDGGTGRGRGAAAGGGGGGQGIESEDTEAEEGQGQAEPLRVVVTHIEKSMGAPVDNGTE